MDGFDDDNKLCSGDEIKLSSPVTVSFSGSAGLSCGEWLSFGAPDLPSDQRSVAPYHACWRSPALTAPLQILGRCRVEVDCSLDTEEGQVYAALCHVMNSKGGGFRLITYGLLNLSGEQELSSD